MFERALIALDLTPAEQPILDCLPALQQWGVSHVVLTHVIRIGYMLGIPLAHEKDFVEWLHKCAQPLRDQGLAVDTQVRSGAVPADEILAAAGETGSDLIVIGSRGENILSKLFLGGVAREVIRKTKLPLLLEWIEPSAGKTKDRCEAVCTETLRHIVFASDFSDRSMAAEKAILALAPKARKVTCVHVTSPEQHADGNSSDAPAQASLAELVDRINGAGGRGRGSLLSGKPSSEIARYAADEDASMIVVGKHGQNWVASMVVGSTAANLCEIAGRPVLMVP